MKADRVWGFIGWAGLLFLLGIVGGMDQGRITVAAGLIGSVSVLAVSAFALKKAGWLAW